MLTNDNKQKQFYEVVHLIKNVQNNVFVSINVEMINLYWNVGQYISAQLSNAAWGDKTVDELADFIQRKYPEIKGFNRRGLYRMKQFFETYSSAKFVSLPMTQTQDTDNQNDEIVSLPMTQFKTTDIRKTILAKISWTHHLTIISRTKTEEEREFYINLCIKERYTVKELDRQGQLNFYLEALDRDVKKHKENPSIGVLLCKDKDNEVVEYAMCRYVSPTMVSEYQTQLPDKKLLQQKLRELCE